MKQLNNKILGFILAGLVILFIGTRALRSSRDTNVQRNLIQLDTSLVSKIVIYPQKQNGKRLHLIKSGMQWQVVEGSRSVPASQNAVKSLLSAISYVGIKRMVSRNKKDWTDYNMSDTTATHLEVYAGDHTLVDCWVGSASTGTGPYTQTATYVRMDSLPQVYETEGFLASVVNKDFDGWRNHKFLRLNKNSITRLQFQYPADSGFTAVRKDSVWMIGDEKADSARMASYLDKVSSHNLSSFADNFKPEGDPDMKLSISGNETTSVNAWKRDSTWVMESSQRPGVYFNSKRDGWIKELMVSKNSLLGEK